MVSDNRGRRRVYAQKCSCKPKHRLRLLRVIDAPALHNGDYSIADLHLVHLQYDDSRRGHQHHLRRGE